MQKFYTRRKKLARKAAAFMSAVMLFSSEAGVFMQDMAYVSAADDEAEGGDVQAEETPEDKGAVTTATDGAFSVTAGELQYGEDGSNANGNLDAIFAPELTVDGVKKVLGTDYTVSYKFFTDKAAAEAVTKENFDEAEGVELASVNAGTEIYAVVKAAAADTDYLVSLQLSVAKRLVSVSYKGSTDAAIEGRDVAEDGSYVIAAEDVDYSGFDLSFADGFVYTADASALFSGDITLDLSAVDLSEDSFSNVPMEVELDPAFDDNYELDKNIHGDYYIVKAQYYVVFAANNNGETFMQTYAFPSYDYKGTAAELLDKLGKTDEVLSKEDGAYNLNGFLDPTTDTLVGWTAYIDGFNASKARALSDYKSSDSYSTINVNADASTYEEYSNGKKLELNGRRDYLFVAEISKAAADNIYVSVIPSVFYDARAHVALGSKTKRNKEMADLRVKVNYSMSGEQSGVEYYTELRNGTDYTLEYFNNTDASMAVSENGTYVPVKTGEARPHVKITGKGRYAGFEATVYFDILPTNLGASEWTYEYLHEKDSTYIDGHNYYGEDYPYTYIGSNKADFYGINKATYLLKKGKVSGINPRVTKHFYSYGYDRDYRRTSNYTYAYLDLVQGKDYQLELYKWNTEGSCWELVEGVTDPNKLTEAGDYLVLVRGMGNYCGAVYGSGENVFASGKDTEGYTNPPHDLSNGHQFRIADSMDYDLSTASISIGVKSVNWDGNMRNSASFNIVVKDKKKNVLTEGIDYHVDFVPKYANRNGAYGGQKISASNKYTVRIVGIGDYYNSKQGGKVTIKGSKLNKKWFELSGTSIVLTEAGISAGLTMSDQSDPKFVGYYTKTSGSNRKVIAGGMRYNYSTYSGDSYSGEAFEPTSSVKFSIKTAKVKKMKLADAIKNGYIRFTVSDNGVYNVKGAVPDSIKYETGKYSSGTFSDYDLYDGWTCGFSVYEPDSTSSIGNVTLKFSFKNNKKVGQKAEVTAKVINSDILTGSAKIGNFTVSTKNVKTVGDYHYMPDVYDMAVSSVFAIVTDELKSKGRLDKPNVKLYQVYRDKNGIKHAAALNAKQYKVIAGEELGTNHIAVSTYAVNGTAAGFNFDPGYESPGAYVGIYALYNAELKPADIKAVNISGLEQEIAVNNGVIDNSYAPVFTGVSITPFVDKVKAANAELDYEADYELWFGDNTAAGDKSGMIFVNPRYNKALDTYEYGGSAMINFKITPADAIRL